MHYILIGFELFIGVVAAYFTLVIGGALLLRLYYFVSDNRDAVLRTLVVLFFLGLLIIGNASGFNPYATRYLH